MIKFILLSFVLSTTTQAKIIASAKSNGHSIKLERLAKINGIPWALTFVNDDEIIITNRDGKLHKLNLSNKKVEDLDGAPKVWSRGQGGLLDITTSPDFSKDNTLYFTYSKPVDNGAATTLAKANYQNGKISNFKDIIVTKSFTTKRHHFGSRITFDNEGHIYFGVGDRGNRDNGQDLSTHAATILRINKDGSVPKTNPFIGQKNALPEIWSYGHRNPQGLVYDKQRKILFEIEHGPRGGDEINIIEPGKNYGWARVSHGKEYWGPISVGEATSMKGMIDGIKVYIPSIAPCGLEVYSGKVFKNWKGNLFTGALAKKHLNRIEVKNKKAVKEERLFENLGYRFRSVKEGPDGYLYVTTDNGLILRVIL